MKCIIPAAGYATRLYPLTLDMPKHLLEVRGKPIIEWVILKVMELDTVDEIFIITNAKYYGNFIAWQEKFKCNLPIKIYNDGTVSNEDRLGQIGDIQFVVDKEKIENDLLVVAGDNLFNFSLLHSYNFFKQKDQILNPLYDAKSLKVAQEQGNASVDKNSRMISFEEKPPRPKSTYVSLGIYYFPRNKVPLFQKYIGEGNNPDKMGYFMIWLLGKEEVYGYVYEEKWFDIGWRESLEKARKEFEG